MLDTEFAEALATEVRAALDDERRAHADALALLRAEIAELRALVKSIPAGRDGRDAPVVPPVPPVPGPRGEPGAPGRDGMTEERMLAEINKRFAALLAACEQRIDARVDGRIAARAVVPWSVYQAGCEYERGVFVTYGGSLWHCNATTRTKPGDNADWTLAVKHGRDGRDR